jgi:hypothetical protein
MTIRTKSGNTYFPAVILWILICFQACLAPSCKDQGRPDHNKQVSITIQTFKIDSINAWGYEILVNRKVYIHQDFVPALEGNHRFKTREEASKVAKAVLKKMKANQSPALTSEEVEELLGQGVK